MQCLRFDVRPALELAFSGVVSRSGSFIGTLTCLPGLCQVSASVYVLRGVTAGHALLRIRFSAGTPRVLIMGLIDARIDERGVITFLYRGSGASMVIGMVQCVDSEWWGFMGWPRSC